MNDDNPWLSWSYVQEHWPELLAAGREHLGITLAAVALACALAVPLADGGLLQWCDFGPGDGDQVSLALQPPRAVPVLAVVLALSGHGLGVSGLVLGGSAYVGAFEMGVTFVLWLMALRHAENPAVVGNLSFLAPVASLFIIRLVVGEPLQSSTLIGLPLIIAGLLVQNRPGGRR